MRLGEALTKRADLQKRIAQLTGRLRRGVPADAFSARYEGRVNFDAADYEFALTGDDGVRLWVDGALVIDRWVNQSATTYRTTRTMSAGVHDLRVEYYEASGQAVVRRRDAQGRLLTQLHAS